VSVDPNCVMTVPVPRNPAPVASSGPVARPIGVIRSIANFDVDANRISGPRKSADAKQSRKKQSKFFHKILLCIFWTDSTLLYLTHLAQAKLSGWNRLDLCWLKPLPVFAN
jgi:hypothetical protein